MPNIRSKKKDVRKIKKRTVKNKAERSGVRTAVKKAKTAPEDKKQELQSTAYSVIDKSLKKGIIKKNTAARYKSRIAKSGKKTKAA
ncbi:MAG: 30S ribosomal protein S20 [Candidatus Goldiibacteriota bacterium]